MTSIEFRTVGTFGSPVFSTRKSARRALRDGVVTATVTLFVPQRSLLFIGLTDGKILCWETDRNLVEKGKKDSTLRTLSEHKGGLRSMIFVESLCSGVMFTGAADRCIKMWDLADPRGAIPCVHSLYGHGGTILTIEYGSEMLLSASTDGCMCIWRDQAPVKLLRFPAYSMKQKITPDQRSVQQGTHRAPKETWFLSISIREGEAPTIFLGDSEGYVHIYKPDAIQDGEPDQIFLLAWKVQIHALGISKIMSVPMESFLFTLSYDQRFKTLDSVTGQVILEESNPCNVIFNSLAWDSGCQDVILGDDRGNIGFYNLYMESCVVWRNLTKDPIIQIHYEPSTRRLLLLSPHELTVVEVVRGVKFAELSEHTGPVVAMASRPTPQGGLLYTAAMDNTIRMWDTDTLECIKSLKEKKHEITAMVYLPRADVVITGHENSDLKMWSLDCQQEALLKTVSGQAVHDNTISALVWTASVAEDASAAGLGAGQAHIGYEIVVAGSYDRQLSFWKITLSNDGNAMAKFERAFVAHEEPDDEVLAVAYSGAANAVFTGGNAGIIRRWAFRGSRRLEAEYDGHKDSAIISFAVDANFLFSGSVDCTVIIWETLQGFRLKTVQVHGATVQALMVIPENGFVVSCAFDGKAIVWDPQIGQDGVKEVQTYEQPEEFRALAFVDMNRNILVGCESGKIIAFPLVVDGHVSAPTALPKVLSDMETPRSQTEAEDHETLEACRRRPADAATPVPT